VNYTESKSQTLNSTDEVGQKPKYVAPSIEIMDENEALSAFQATAAGSAMWWVA